MDEIYKNLSSPEWWFNGLFFVLVGAVVPFFFLKVIPFIGRTLITRTFRNLRAKRLRRIKRIRWDSVKVSYETSKSAALLAAFMSSSALYFVSMAMTISIISSIPGEEDFVANNLFFSMVIFSMLFVLAMEIAYFKKRLFVISLLIRRDRIFRRRVFGKM
jgi:hypothetical protein